ncbi:type 2 lanthipeptide synthetase LanM family protein [Amycolatopsis circi]|uniref:type 2 lanthipeptide synthetase LanM family protein n=1 Tax=Amycolatopsis circi TaxID=871959 RepID=UPI000E246068|nr:type 2 lanthipeptide synthetase LanM family protein [Amycolatopsis circi]
MSRAGSEPSGAYGGPRCFRPAAQPLVNAASRQLRAALPESDAAELAAVSLGMADWLSDRLCAAAARTLVARLKTESFASLLAGDPLPDVLAQHPGLAELLAALTRNAIAAAVELLARFDQDRALIAGFLGSDPGRVMTVAFGRGDAHCGGRTVSELGFASGARLIYRPRPVGLHARWNDLLADLAPLLGDLAPSGAAVLERPGYGWVEYVHARPAADVGQFYHRLGAQLALLHVLGATDIHAENVVAAGDHPIVVDVETLFQPRWTPHTDGGSDPALTALETSVLNTFVLPRPVFGPHGRLDLSAFGGRPGQFPHDLPVWAEAGTDRMRLVRGPAPYAGGQNLPAPSVDPAAYAGAFLDGLRTAYRSLAAGRDTVLHGLDRFAGAELRIVPRASEWYADLLRESTEPVFLREIDGRAKAFAALDEVTAYPHFARFADASRADLLAGDIPYFAASVDGREVRTASGARLPEVLETDGLTAARARIASLGERDLSAQLWFAEAALATMTPFAGHRLLPGSAVSQETPDPARLLDLAVGIGDDLLRRGNADAVRINWPSLEIAEDGDWCVRQLGASLGSGYCGVALFLAELGKISGRDRFLDAAARTVRPLPGLIELLDSYASLAVGVGPGAFSGLGGIAYTVTRLAGLLADSTFESLIPAALRATAAAARAAEAADVADGLAGALLAVSAVAVENGSSDAGALVEELGERLAALSPLRTAGFLFGRAGVTHALRLAGRVPSGSEGQVTGLGWCSGLAGLVLADPRPSLVARFRTELEQRHPSPDHSLCHGELGVLDAARSVGAPVRLPRGELACGTPGAVPAPGLLHGLAGIGHGLLRLGFADRVPALSLLEPAPGMVPVPDHH